MFCARCGGPVPDAARFCPACGMQVGSSPGAPSPPTPSSVPPPQFAVSAPPSRLTNLNRLVMAHSKIEVATPLPFSRPHVVFHFEDPSGQPVGEATAEAGFPAQYTLLDENRTTVLVLDAVRAQGLRFDFLLHDSRGAALGSLEMRRGSWGPKGLSAWGRKFAVAIGGKEVMALTSNPTGSLFQLVDLNSGSVLASASTKWAVTTARTQIEIAEAFPVDHRVVLGAFLMLSYTASGLR